MRRLIYALAPLLLLLVLAGCGKPVVGDKKMVSMSFKGTLTADSTVFAESEQGTPLEFLFGAGGMFPALETAMKGMKVGEKKTIPVKAADAYGEYDQAAIQEVPREQFPADVELQAGASYQFQTSQGPIAMTIKALKDKTVTVDFNHPLAGKDLTFEIEIVKIRDATKEELAAAAPAQPDQTGQPATPQ